MSTQVAVRLDPELLERLDWVMSRRSFENRAEAIRAAITQMARLEREREIDDQIIASYSATPQDSSEIPSPNFQAWDDLDEDDWSDWK
jgi:metal-responsive CopG/Arc/MetJ family transcriptional regulator